MYAFWATIDDDEDDDDDDDDDADDDDDDESIEGSIPHPGQITHH